MFLAFLYRNLELWDFLNGPQDSKERLKRWVIGDLCTLSPNRLWIHSESCDKHMITACTVAAPGVHITSYTCIYIRSSPTIDVYKYRDCFETQHQQYLLQFMPLPKPLNSLYIIMLNSVYVLCIELCTLHTSIYIYIYICSTHYCEWMS